jgi:hypothetical protein
MQIAQISKPAHIQAMAGLPGLARKRWPHTDAPDVFGKKDEHK